MKVVIKPVVDLRRQPSPWDGFVYKDLLQETQLLFGEQVRVLEEWGDWVLVEALEQEVKTREGLWQGYTGWLLATDVADTEQRIQSSLVVKVLWADVYSQPDIDSDPIMEVSLGTRLQAESLRNGWWCVVLPQGDKGWVQEDEVLVSPPAPRSEEWRQDVLDLAKQFVGSPYFWGGRSGFKPQKSAFRTGVDCSSLVQLIYRVLGVDVPRNAYDQLLKAKEISPDELEPADLVFMTSEPTSSRIDHVMFYAGNELLLEATIKVNQVRTVSFQDKVGVSLANLKKGERPDSIQIAFARFE